MKKYAKKVLCLVLAVLMLGVTVVPARAASTSIPVTYGMFTANCTVTCNETNGTATISLTPTASAVTVYVQNSLYNSLNNLYGVSSEVKSISFAYATATADNILVEAESGYRFVSEVTKTTGRFFVGNEAVLPGLNDYPG